MLAASLVFGFFFVALLFTFSRWLDDQIVCELATFALVVELMVSFILTNSLSNTDSICVIELGHLILGSSTPNLHILFCYDILSGYFFTILGLALIICFYFLMEYFEYDASVTNIALLSALFSQLALMFFVSFDLFLIIFFWEMISIVSFLLVQHWSHRLCTYKAGLKVFTISQFGDFPVLFFLFVFLNRIASTNLFDLTAVVPLLAIEIVRTPFGYMGLLTLLGSLLMFSVFLKAAQFFFYPWLLDAMEAPVPISAQLHSSTLVIIGFYMIYRFHLIYNYSIALSSFFMWAGLITVVGASILAVYQIDGKRLLACSTASQLGYIVTAFGLGLYDDALSLLAFCCCNKAFTFVWFGVLMNHVSGVSDFRFLSGSVFQKWLPHAGMTIAVANFTILPGVFSWHVKTLFIQGRANITPFGSEIAVEVLQLTWFFSSIYLLWLYVTLFLKPSQGSNAKKILSQISIKPANVYIQLTRQVSLSFYIVSLVTFLVLIAPGIFGLLSVTDVTFYSSELFGLHSYY